MSPADKEDFWKRWRAAKDRYEACQKDVLAAIYVEGCRPMVRAWAKRADELCNQSGSATIADIHRVNERILALVVEGQRISRDMAPYLEAGVDAAAKDSQESGPDKQLNRLSQLREWNYNRWALDRVETVERAGGSDLDRLRSLSVVHDLRLAPTSRNASLTCGSVFSIDARRMTRLRRQSSAFSGSTNDGTIDRVACGCAFSSQPKVPSCARNL